MDYTNTIVLDYLVVLVLIIILSINSHSKNNVIITTDKIILENYIMSIVK